MENILEEMKSHFQRQSDEERQSFFSAPSNTPEFTNSQLFFHNFSKGYKLYNDEFPQLCTDMKNFLGKELYSQLMDNLVYLRDKKAQQIKNDAPEYLTHTSNTPPETLGQYLSPRNNLNQFGEKRDNFLFATDNDRDFYALRVNDTKGKNINWKKKANVNGEEKNVFIMEQLNDNSYTYFVPKKKFTPVVCLDGRYGHEWTATEKIQYSHCEKNNVEAIQARNIVMLVEGEAFRSQDETFFRNLNNPDLILDTLNNSGALKNTPTRLNSVRERLNQTQQHNGENLSANGNSSNSSASHISALRGLTHSNNTPNSTTTKTHLTSDIYTLHQTKEKTVGKT